MSYIQLSDPPRQYVDHRNIQQDQATKISMLTSHTSPSQSRRASASSTELSNQEEEPPIRAINHSSLAATTQSQNDALYRYAHSIICATPKRERPRLSRNAEPAVDDSLALLLSWGAEKKSDSTSDVAADDMSIPKDNSPDPDGVVNEGIGRTWIMPRLGSILAVLIPGGLAMVLLLFWHGVFLMSATMIRK